MSAEIAVIELPQGRVSYRVAGPEAAATTVVFVHGLLVDGRLWTATADALADRGIRSYAPTWPLGSQRTPMSPDADLSPRGVAAIVLAFLEALELTDVVLVGNDTGGAICQFVIDTDASRVGRLVLTNCDAFDKFPPAPFTALVRAGRHEKLLGPLFASMAPTFARHSPLGFGMLSRHLDPEVTRGWIEGGRRERGVRRDLAKLMRGIAPKELLDVSTRLNRFAKPVQLVWGDADPFFKIAFAERLAETFPDATLVRVEGCRTFVPLDEPVRLATEIADFRAS